ncbi:hypothetical protein BX600DRAFT_515871 [Xylariales sp. PMI_506]|nr:hypothetical protein BX600DRAFT_515871 [Xylariales sp. PMI_506]
MDTISLTVSGAEAGAEIAPLTTIWSVPSGCPSAVTFQSISEIYHSSVDQHCAPPDYENVWWRIGGYYSPGICFSGYTIGCTATGTILNNIPIKSTETAAVCVPSGYTCEPWFNSADSTIWAGLSVATATSPQYWTCQSEVPAFQIRWAASDLSLLASSPSWSLTTNSVGLQVAVEIAATDTISTTGSGSGSASPSTLSTLPIPTSSTTTTSSSDGGSKLSTGAIVGIAIGGVLALGIVLAAFFLVRYRRRRRPADNFHPGETTGELEANPPPNQELDGDEAERKDYLPLSRGDVFELDGAHVNKDVSELDTVNEPKPVPELEGKGQPQKESEKEIVPESGLEVSIEDDKEVVEQGEAVGGMTDTPQSPPHHEHSTRDGNANPASTSQAHDEASWLGRPKPPQEEEAASLRRQLEALEERRRRLAALQDLDDQQDAIRKRLELLQKQTP